MTPINSNLTISKLCQNPTNTNIQISQEQEQKSLTKSLPIFPFHPGDKYLKVLIEDLQIADQDGKIKEEIAKAYRPVSLNEEEIGRLFTLLEKENKIDGRRVTFPLNITITLKEILEIQQIAIANFKDQTTNHFKFGGSSVIRHLGISYVQRVFDQVFKTYDSNELLTSSFKDYITSECRDFDIYVFLIQATDAKFQTLHEALVELLVNKLPKEHLNNELIYDHLKRKKRHLEKNDNAPTYLKELFQQKRVIDFFKKNNLNFNEKLGKENLHTLYWLLIKVDVFTRFKHIQSTYVKEEYKNEFIIQTLGCFDIVHMIDWVRQAQTPHKSLSLYLDPLLNGEFRKIIPFSSIGADLQCFSDLNAGIITTVPSNGYYEVKDWANVMTEKVKGARCREIDTERQFLQFVIETASQEKVALSEKIFQLLKVEAFSHFSNNLSAIIALCYNMSISLKMFDNLYNNEISLLWQKTCEYINTLLFSDDFLRKDNLLYAIYEVAKMDLFDFDTLHSVIHASCYVLLHSENNKKQNHNVYLTQDLGTLPSLQLSIPLLSNKKICLIFPLDSKTLKNLLEINNHNLFLLYKMILKDSSFKLNNSAIKEFSLLPELQLYHFEQFALQNVWDKTFLGTFSHQLFLAILAQNGSIKNITTLLNSHLNFNESLSSMMVSLFQGSFLETVFTKDSSYFLAYEKYLKDRTTLSLLDCIATLSTIPDLISCQIDLLTQFCLKFTHNEMPKLKSILSKIIYSESEKCLPIFDKIIHLKQIDNEEKVKFLLFFLLDALKNKEKTTSLTVMNIGFTLKSLLEQCYFSSKNILNSEIDNGLTTAITFFLDTNLSLARSIYFSAVINKNISLHHAKEIWLALFEKRENNLDALFLTYFCSKYDIWLALEPSYQAQVYEIILKNPVPSISYDENKLINLKNYHYLESVLLEFFKVKLMQCVDFDSLLSIFQEYSTHSIKTLSSDLLLVFFKKIEELSLPINVDQKSLNLLLNLQNQLKQVKLNGEELFKSYLNICKTLINCQIGNGSKLFESFFGNLLELFTTHSFKTDHLNVLFDSIPSFLQIEPFAKIVYDSLDSHINKLATPSLSFDTFYSCLLAVWSYSRKNKFPLPIFPLSVFKIALNVMSKSNNEFDHVCVHETFLESFKAKNVDENEKIEIYQSLYFLHYKNQVWELASKCLEYVLEHSENKSFILPSALELLDNFLKLEQSPSLESIVICLCKYFDTFTPKQKKIFLGLFTDLCKKASLTQTILMSLNANEVLYNAIKGHKNLINIICVNAFDYLDSCIVGKKVFTLALTKIFQNIFDLLRHAGKSYEKEWNKLFSLLSFVKDKQLLENIYIYLVEVKDLGKKNYLGDFPFSRNAFLNGLKILFKSLQHLSSSYFIDICLNIETFHRFLSTFSDERNVCKIIVSTYKGAYNYLVNVKDKAKNPIIVSNLIKKALTYQIYDKLIVGGKSSKSQYDFTLYIPKFILLTKNQELIPNALLSIFDLLSSFTTDYLEEESIFEILTSIFQTIHSISKMDQTIYYGLISLLEFEHPNRVNANVVLKILYLISHDKADFTKEIEYKNQMASLTEHKAFFCLQLLKQKEKDDHDFVKRTLQEIKKFPTIKSLFLVKQIIREPCLPFKKKNFVNWTKKVKSFNPIQIYFYHFKNDFSIARRCALRKKNIESYKKNASGNFFCRFVMMKHEMKAIENIGIRMIELITLVSIVAVGMFLVISTTLHKKTS